MLDVKTVLTNMAKALSDGKGIVNQLEDVVDALKRERVFLEDRNKKIKEDNSKINNDIASRREGVEKYAADESAKSAKVKKEAEDLLALAKAKNLEADNKLRDAEEVNRRSVVLQEDLKNQQKSVQAKLVQMESFVAKIK